MPALRPGDVVIMDNLSSHKRAVVREMIETAGAVLLPDSPNFNRIDKAFSRLKAMLHDVSERALSRLWGLIGKLVGIFRPDEWANYFSLCGYEPK